MVQDVFSIEHEDTLITEEFKKEHLIHVQYFSSNSCQFLKDTNLLKTAACPIGHFSCARDGSIIEVNRTLEFTEAEAFCLNENGHLSKLKVVSALEQF